MEKLAIKLANKIGEELKLDDEKRQVILYGLIALVQLVFTVFFVLLLGLLFGTPIEALLICFSVSLLRKYSGGAHVGSMGLCTFLGVAYSVIFALISRYLLLPILTPIPLMIALVAVYTVSFWAIYRLAPVDSPNKPIKTAKKQKRMRKGSFIVLLVYAGISIVLLLLGRYHPIFNSFNISMLFGILWQILTLTKIGAVFLNRIDLIASNLFGEKRR